MQGNAGYANQAINRGSAAYAGDVPSSTKQSALQAHVMADRAALDMAASNLDRLRRIKVRLAGVTNLNPGADKPPSPQMPEGTVPCLDLLARDMASVLTEMAGLISELDEIV